MSTVLKEPLERQLYSLKEYAQIVGLTYPTVQRLAKAGRIPGQVRLGLRAFVPKRAVDAWLSAGGVGLASGGDDR